MSSSIAAGTFANGTSASTGGNPSDVCIIPSGRTSMKLTLTGCDANNRVKSQKRTAGGVFTDQTTYSTDQNAVAVPVVAGEEWRVITIAQQAIREIRYVLDAQ
jgi:hypothetical protein